MHFSCIQNHVFIDYFNMLHMTQLNSKKTRFPLFDKILVIQPLQRCMVRVRKGNSARRLTDYVFCKSMADERQKVESFARNMQFVQFCVKKGKTTGISFNPGLWVLTLVHLKWLVFDSQNYLSKCQFDAWDYQIKRLYQLLTAYPTKIWASISINNINYGRHTWPCLSRDQVSESIIKVW